MDGVSPTTPAVVTLYKSTHILEGFPHIVSVGMIDLKSPLMEPFATTKMGTDAPFIPGTVLYIGLCSTNYDLHASILDNVAKYKRSSLVKRTAEICEVLGLTNFMMRGISLRHPWLVRQRDEVRHYLLISFLSAATHLDTTQRRMSMPEIIQQLEYGISAVMSYLQATSATPVYANDECSENEDNNARKGQ